MAASFVAEGMESAILHIWPFSKTSGRGAPRLCRRTRKFYPH